MKAVLERLREDALRDLGACSDEKALEALRVRYLGRNGELTRVLRGLRDVPPAERPRYGKLANELKAVLEGRVDGVRDQLRQAEIDRRLRHERIDVTVPGRRPELGHVHPVTRIMDEVVQTFLNMGFSVAEGPDVEDDYHNFEALNFPKDHPARDMQDTFFLTAELLLRTHTSPVQIRVMENRPPPLRVIAPGAVYRHDSDLTHAPMFHQVEGFMVDKAVTFGDLKGVLTLALQSLFGSGLEVRFRPSFFPFTEPSAEVDIACFQCGRRDPGCRICKGTGWVEVLGAGLIDPNVFRGVGYDPEAVSGFAFGMGIERLAMLKYQINDIRLFLSNDLRFLRQF